MRTINFSIMVIGVVIVMLAGLLCLASAVYPDLLVMAGDFIAGPLAFFIGSIMGRAISFVLGIAIMLGLIYLFFGNLHAAKRERTVVLQNPAGEVLVSLPAIEDFARIVKGKIEGLRDIKGKVVFSRKGLKVTARVSIYADQNLAEVAEKVQESVRAYVQQTLNIEQEINPTVIVTKVVNRERPPETAGIKTSVTRKKEDTEDRNGTTELPIKK